MKRWGLFLLGVGVGATLGVEVGDPASVPALAAVALGLVLLVIKRRSGELVEDALAGGGAARPEAAGERPSLAHLGSRVEQILSIAEQQAAKHVAEAKVTAEQIVAQARAEADRIKPE
jgi:hypothetical protein